MTREDRSYCDQNLQSAAILHKKLNIFIFSFISTLVLLFSKIFSIEYFTRPWHTYTHMQEKSGRIMLTVFFLVRSSCQEVLYKQRTFEI